MTFRCLSRLKSRITTPQATPCGLTSTNIQGYDSRLTPFGGRFPTPMLSVYMNARLHGNGSVCLSEREKTMGNSHILSSRDIVGLLILLTVFVFSPMFLMWCGFRNPPKPNLQECPHCGAQNRRTSTRCYCCGHEFILPDIGVKSRGMTDNAVTNRRQLADPGKCRTRYQGKSLDITYCLKEVRDECEYAATLGPGVICLHPDRRKFEKTKKA